MKIKDREVKVSGEEDNEKVKVEVGFRGKKLHRREVSH